MDERKVVVTDEIGEFDKLVDVVMQSSASSSASSSSSTAEQGGEAPAADPAADPESSLKLGSARHYSAA